MPTELSPVVQEPKPSLESVNHPGRHGRPRWAAAVRERLAYIWRRLATAALVKTSPGLLWAYARIFDLRRTEFEFYRSLVLQREMTRLQRIMARLGYPLNVLIGNQRAYVEADGVFLSPKGTYRYFKVVDAVEANQGRALYAALQRLGIHPRSFIDVGPNYGEVALWFARHVPAADILAVEASPENFRILEDNIAYNARYFDTARLRTASVAVSDQRGEVEFSVGFGSENTMILGRDNPQAVHVRRTTRVVAEPLGDLVASYDFDTVDCMKIDIEGAEPLLASELLRVRPRALFIEFSTKNTREAYLGLLASLMAGGYRCWTAEAEPLADVEQACAHVAGIWESSGERFSWGSGSRDLWFTRGA